MPVIHHNIHIYNNGIKINFRDKSATQNRRCKAVYSYTQNNNDELTLAVGDIIEFLGEVNSFTLTHTNC